MPDPTLTLPQQSGDVGVGDVAGHDVSSRDAAGRDFAGRDVHQGVDPGPVIDLLGNRLERQLEHQAEISNRILIAVALLVLSQMLALMLWGPTVFLLLRPDLLVAGR